MSKTLARATHTVAFLGLAAWLVALGTALQGDQIGPTTSGRFRPTDLRSSSPARSAARASPDGKLLFAVNTPDNRLEIFRAQGHRACGTAASVPVGLEPVAVAVARRARSGSSTTSPTASASSTCADGRAGARRAHAAGRRRAARHRVRRPGRKPRLHHHRAPRPEHRPSIRSSPRPASAAPTSGCSTPAPRHGARRHAAHDHHAVHRHAARARGLADGTRSTPPLPHRQPHHDRPPSAFGQPTRRAACRGPITNVDGRAAPRRLIVSPHRQARRRRTGSTSSAASGTTQVSFSLPDKDVFAIDATAEPAAGRGPARRSSTPASAPCCSTWPSTR